VRRLATLAAAALVLAMPAAAAAACPQTTLGDVEDEVMCPVCGTPLSVATEAPQAQRERELIQRLIARCRSKDEIKQVLAAQFGDDVLATPEDEGFDLAAYLVPALGLLLAAGAVGLTVVRWRRGRRGPAAEGPDPAGPGGARLDADLDRYDL
jgi:cytochrome c-type biogenesis protein CcmH